MTTAERAGIMLGVLGFVLSVINTWRLWWKDRSHLRVEVTRLPARRDIEVMLRVRVANHGHRTVPVSRLGLVHGRRQHVFMGTWGPMGSNAEPFDLEPGRSRSVVEPERFAINALRAEGHTGTVQLRGGCWDQLGKLYRSKPITVQVEPADTMGGTVATHHEEESPE